MQGSCTFLRWFSTIEHPFVTLEIDDHETFLLHASLLNTNGKLLLSYLRSRQWRRAFEFDCGAGLLVMVDEQWLHGSKGCGYTKKLYSGKSRVVFVVGKNRTSGLLLVCLVRHCEGACASQI
jgi:hypothetical protein